MTSLTVPNSSLPLDGGKQRRSLSCISASCWVYWVGWEVTWLCVQFSISGRECLQKSSTWLWLKVGSSLYSKPPCIVCSEIGASFGSGVPKCHTSSIDTIKFWTFHSLEGRIFSKAWHLAATGTFCTNFVRSKALSKAAVLGLPWGPPSLDHHKNDDSCLHNLLLWNAQSSLL